MDTEGFIQYIRNYYAGRFNIQLDEELFNQWIYNEDIPADCPKPSSDRFKKVDQLLAAWKTEKTLDKSQAKDWSTHEWLHFLKNLPETLSQEQMEKLDDFGNFSASGNSEIIAAWGVVSIRNNYEKMFPKIESFLINTGRRKFLSPLYEENDQNQ
jgi:Leukotriene A4 hydrolase, C-terminal.